MSTLGELLKRVAQGTKSAAAENAHIGFFGKGPQVIANGDMTYAVVPQSVAREAKQIMANRTAGYGWPADGEAGYFHDFEREHGFPPALGEVDKFRDFIPQHYSLAVGDSVDRLGEIFGPGNRIAQEMWFDASDHLDNPELLDEVLAAFPDYGKGRMRFNEPATDAIMWADDIRQPYSKDPYPLRTFSAYGPSGGEIAGVRYGPTGGKVVTKLEPILYNTQTVTPDMLPPHIQKNWEEYQIQDPRLY